jgi:hypothetical protein
MTPQEFKYLIKEALEEAGLISPFISRKEVIEQIGRHRYEKAIKAGHIKRNKLSGKNAQVRLLRAEFMALTLKGII